MTAAAPSNMGHHQYIPLAKLTPSPLNHRKRFDEVKLDELVGSVRAQGVIQPILARPLSGDKFEVVAGERRFRAAKKAGLADIPAVVRDLTDEQVLELQMIENSQREDVHPLEEAEGYDALLKCRKDPKDPYTIDRLVQKSGKSRGTIYARLKLLALTKEGRQAFYDGTLDSSRALLLARIPLPDLQQKALKEILDDRYGRGAMSYREAAEHIQDEYMLQLRGAPFKPDDPDLVPAAGACTTCPKRTGTNPELFPDVKSADVCTDPKCFAAKRGAHFVQIKAQAVAKGREVVSGKDARDYVRLDDRCNSDGKYRTYREILGKAAPAKPALMPDTRGDKPKLVDAVRKDEIEAVLEKKGASLPAANATGAREKEQLEQEIGDEITRRTYQHCIAALPKELSKEELKWLIDAELFGDPDQELVQELLLPTNKKDNSPGVAQRLIEKAIPQLDVAGLTRLLLALHLSVEINYGYTTERLTKAAKHYGVDVAAIKAAVKAEAKAKAKAAADAKEKAAA
jgi:ParB/RepB/Spo0J family partition protein